MTGADTLNHARPFAAALVDREERRTGSRMTAYEIVASTVGVSSSWLRKLLGRQPGLIVEAHEFLNIAHAYRSLCERIEAEAQRERALAAALREKADAALASAPVLVPGAAGAPRDRTPP